jgi:hypothetical protein
MEQTLKVRVLTEWKDLTLKKYLEMIKDVDAYKDDEEAMTALMIHHLCGIDYSEIQNLSAKSYNKLKETISKFKQPEEMELQRFINIAGVEYGFEPNLSKMTYGAYADISKYDTLTIDKNWAKIMSILYRPVTKKDKHGLYIIKPYDGEIDETIWLDVTMDIHFGCLFFFINLQMDLMIDTLKSLTETELPHNTHTILVKSGEVMQRYMNLPKGI